jgi:hypothetical protein
MPFVVGCNQAVMAPDALGSIWRVIVGRDERHYTSLLSIFCSLAWKIQKYCDSCSSNFQNDSFFGRNLLISSCANTLSCHVGLYEQHACRNSRYRAGQCRRFAKHVAAPPPLPGPVQAVLPLLVSCCRPCEQMEPGLLGSSPFAQRLSIGQVPDATPSPQFPVPPSQIIAGRDVGQAPKGAGDCRKNCSLTRLAVGPKKPP